VVSIFRRWCQLQPDKVLYTWLDDDGKELETWTYTGLQQRTDAVARKLLTDWHCNPGDRVVLMYLPGLPFISAFWGCLFSGVIAVPVYPIDLRNKFKIGVQRFGRIVDSCEPKLVMTHSKYHNARRLAMLTTAFQDAAWPVGLEFYTTDNLDECDRPQGVMPTADQLSFLQYTSGSTGDPKGVMLNQRNLAANQRCLAVGLGADLEAEVEKVNSEDSGTAQGPPSARVVELEAKIARHKAAYTTQAPGDGLSELQARLKQAGAANEQWSSYANGVAAEKAEIKAEAQQLRGVPELTVAALTQTQGSPQVKSPGSST
jgi:acyl-CoA synthetase (AMP-forming)/AMP-acid ligase II